MLAVLSVCVFFFFFNDTATTEIYTLSLHDALPICWGLLRDDNAAAHLGQRNHIGDRKSTRLNSSHQKISYAVFCLKKKKQTQKWRRIQKKKQKTDLRKSKRQER